MRNDTQLLLTYVQIHQNKTLKNKASKQAHLYHHHDSCWFVCNCILPSEFKIVFFILGHKDIEWWRRAWCWCSPLLPGKSLSLSLSLRAKYLSSFSPNWNFLENKMGLRTKPTVNFQPFIIFGNVGCSPCSCRKKGNALEWHAVTLSCTRALSQLLEDDLQMMSIW